MNKGSDIFKRIDYYFFTLISGAILTSIIGDYGIFARYLFYYDFIQWFVYFFLITIILGGGITWIIYYLIFIFGKKKKSIPNVIEDD